jgi:signal transduction histidine kinase
MRARQALETNNQHLTHTNAELDTFVYAASHDLQGPLNNIAVLLHILRKALPAANQPALVTRTVDLLYDSAKRFQHTLTQLGTVARVQAEASLPASPVPLADVVQGVLHDLALPIAEAGAQITVDVAACPLVSFAEKNLRSVVYNLLSNAVKYRHPDREPQVRVQGRAEATFRVLEVQDNGLGLSFPADGSTFNLFQRFRTHVEGSGVGLYLVQQLVERNGGRLEVRSQLGQGATFTVYFKR